MKHIVTLLCLLLTLHSYGRTNNDKKYSFWITSKVYTTDVSPTTTNQTTWIILYYDSIKHRYEGDINKDINNQMWHFASYQNWTIAKSGQMTIYSIEGKLETKTQGILDIKIEIHRWQKNHTDNCYVTFYFPDNSFVIFDDAWINGKFTGDCHRR